jgi:hypothetical protein
MRNSNLYSSADVDAVPATAQPSMGDTSPGLTSRTRKFANNPVLQPDDACMVLLSPACSACL